MKIEIYDESKPEEKPKPLLLRLVPDGCGGVDLRVVDEHGRSRKGGCLLGIDRDGVVHFATHVDEVLGLPLDDAGRLLLGEDH